MRLTTKGRFAVTAMADLAIHNDQGSVTLASISERQSISQSYLEQLFGKLRKQHIVVAVRGPGGGYNLARPSAQINIADIIEAVDEIVDSTRCGGMANCHDGQQCITHDLWEGLNKTIHGYLAEVSLQQLVSSQSALTKGVSLVAMPKKSNKPKLVAV